MLGIDDFMSYFIPEPAAENHVSRRDAAGTPVSKLWSRP